MSGLFERSSEIENLVCHQLKLHWTDINQDVIHDAIPNALAMIEEGFTGLPSERFSKDGAARFSPYMSVHWMIFLYRLAHEIYKNGGVTTPKEADQVYYLNKIMHSNDWLYAIDLPIHFLCEHPLGSVLGRAEYGDYLCIYQGTTVGGNRREGRIYYPVIGVNVILYANATVLGDSRIGNNVVISADTFLINETIPDNCVVFGHSPNITIKAKSEGEMKKYTEHIWGWSGR